MIYRLLAASVFACSLSMSTAAQPNPGYDLASTYIRMLSNLETIRSDAERDMKRENNPIEGCVRNMESLQLELDDDVANIKNVRMAPQYQFVPATLAKILETKRDIYRQMQDGCAEMIEQKPGVDYGAIAANAPKLNARLDYVDNAMFKTSPLVFSLLIASAPDAHGHMSHLSITRAQMKSLADTIKLDFGKKIDADHQNYTVSAASTLYFYLTQKGYKGSDES